MVPSFHLVSTVVASVHKLVRALVVQLEQHGHTRIFGPPQRGELVVAVPCHGEECVPPIHQVTVDAWVGFLNGLQGKEMKKNLFTSLLQEKVLTK